jgi:hypothetical protein
MLFVLIMFIVILKQIENKFKNITFKIINF